MKPDCALSILAQVSSSSGGSSTYPTQQSSSIIRSPWLKSFIQ